MSKKTIPLTIQRVAANTVALIELPINPTYETIRFALTGTGLVPAMIGRIAVVANSDVIQEYLNLQQLLDINSQHGMGVDTIAEFFLFFRKSWLVDFAEQKIFSLGTADLRTLTIEIQLLATPADIAFELTAEVDTMLQPLGVYNRIKQTPLNAAVAGVITWPNLPKGGDFPNVYTDIHFFKADINRIYLEANGVKIIDATKNSLEAVQKKARPTPMVPVTARATHLPFNPDLELGDYFRTDGISDLRLDLTFGTSGACQIVTEEIATYRG